MEKLDRDSAWSLDALLRQFRVAGGLTQEALADRSGVSARTIQDVERGLRIPRVDTVRRLSIALGLTGERLTRFEAGVRPRPRQRAATTKSRHAESDRVEYVATPARVTPSS